MTEWEKLQSGQIYNDFDDDLFRRRLEAKKLFRAYNKTEDDETDLEKTAHDGFVQERWQRCVDRTRFSL